MKPKNFPGRKLMRQLRAAARLNGQPQPQPDPSVADITYRCGKANRSPDGVGRITSK